MTAATVAAKAATCTVGKSMFLASVGGLLRTTRRQTTFTTCAATKPETNEARVVATRSPIFMPYIMAVVAVFGTRLDPSVPIMRPNCWSSSEGHGVPAEIWALDCVCYDRGADRTDQRSVWLRVRQGRRPSNLNRVMPAKEVEFSTVIAAFLGGLTRCPVVASA